MIMTDHAFPTCNYHHCANMALAGSATGSGGSTGTTDAGATTRRGRRGRPARAARRQPARAVRRRPAPAARPTGAGGRTTTGAGGTTGWRRGRRDGWRRRLDGRRSGQRHRRTVGFFEQRMQLRRRGRRRRALEQCSARRTARAAPPPQEVARESESAAAPIGQRQQTVCGPVGVYPPEGTALARRRPQASGVPASAGKTVARRPDQMGSDDSRTRTVTFELAGQKAAGRRFAIANTVPDGHQGAGAALSGGDATSAAIAGRSAGDRARGPAAAAPIAVNPDWTWLGACGHAGRS